METVFPPIPANNKRIYNIALYGLTGSGKTCLLAALAMDRYPNPFGFTVTWLTSAAQTGKELLNKAVIFLEKHQTPPPNPNSNNYYSYGFAQNPINFFTKKLTFSTQKHQKTPIYSPFLPLLAQSGHTF